MPIKINTSKLAKPNTTDARKLVQQVTLVISVTPSQNATDTRKLVKRVALVISMTPSQNNNGIQTASLAANRPEGVGRLLMSQ